MGCRHMRRTAWTDQLGVVLAEQTHLNPPRLCQCSNKAVVLWALLFLTQALGDLSVRVESLAVAGPMPVRERQVVWLLSFLSSRE
jgi:hypothetical protein